MIKPNKHTDIRYSVLNIGAEIISVLQNEGVMKYDDLQRYITEKYSKAALVNFVPAINVLYCFNKIKYHLEIDSIEFLNEA